MIIYLEIILNLLFSIGIMTNEEINKLVKQGELKTLNEINYLKIIDKIETKK